MPDERLSLREEAERDVKDCALCEQHSDREYVIDLLTAHKEALAVAAKAIKAWQVDQEVAGYESSATRRAVMECNENPLLSEYLRRAGT